MKKLSTTLLVVFAVTMILPVTVLAASPIQTASPLDKVLEVFLQFGSLAGFAAAITAVVNVFKAFGAIKDGTAGKWVAGLNLIALSALVYLKLFQPQIAIEYIDAQAAVAAQIAMLILGYIVQLGAGTWAHGVLSKLRLPWIGYSHSLQH